jgi:hypothetical protein
MLAIRVLAALALVVLAVGAMMGERWEYILPTLLVLVLGLLLGMVIVVGAVAPTRSGRHIDV